MPRDPHAASADTVDSWSAPALGYDTDDLVTGEAVVLDMRPADFILRAAGAAIDWVAYAILYFVVVIVLVAVGTSIFDEATITALSIVALVMCVVAVPVTVETVTQGRSLGKLAIGARIVRDDGGAIGFRHALIRGLLAVIEILMTLGGIATVVALLNPRAKRLGDILAGTYSQHERVSKFTPPVHGVPLELVEWSKTADVARLPGGLSRRIAQFLRQAQGHSATSRVRIAHELAAEASRYVSPIPNADAELFLAAVAAVRRDREYLALYSERQRLAALDPVLHGLPHRFPNR